MSQNPNSGTGNTAQGRQGQQSQQGTAQGQQTQNAQQGSGQGTPQSNQPPQRQAPNSTTEEVGSWFTETIVRAGILVIGVAVMLFAIGQAVGANLVEPMAEFFTSGTGAWFVVAFLALLVMVAATKSWRTVN
ncbi:hypothetical protein ACFPYI_21155 [Halomarina salina]|uniref:Uncharacterized protein n=1 Tax=Halomarina salina TaxID=1872699 RepID=A0ABD5RU22_9EURY|nr:hypothetical protein [Halomarina salina]